VLLVLADAYALAKARQATRTLLALREVEADQVRLKRFNAEQRDQLSKRLAASSDRLPHQVVMTYRHLALLGETNGQLVVDRVDLGPAAADATITSQVVSYLTNTDRLVTNLAPATLLSSRFGLLPEGENVVDIETLASWFGQLVRLPKLADRDVLRRALATGATQRLFALVSGSAADAPDAVIRFGTSVEPNEIQFQPGTWLVRASTAADLIAPHEPPTASPAPPAATSATPADGPRAPTATAAGEGSATVRHVRIQVDGVPSERMREVLRTAILPLAGTGADVAVDMVIVADSPSTGIATDTLELTVLEGLRQLGLTPSIELER
jgi:hypothetical protein